jgi:hypothetical protein
VARAVDLLNVIFADRPTAGQYVFDGRETRR